jgi:putative oxidoreductase
MSVGLLILRVTLGLLFVGHGTQKLFGWFGGGGLSGTENYFASLGYPRTKLLPLVAGSTEAGSGILLAAGFLTPFAAAGLIGMMVNVVGVKWSHGVWEMRDGFEYPLLICAAAAALAFVGPGRYALDRAAGWALSGAGWGFAALGVGIVVGVAARASARGPGDASHGTGAD